MEIEMIEEIIKTEEADGASGGNSSGARHDGNRNRRHRNGDRRRSGKGRSGGKGKHSEGVPTSEAIEAIAAFDAPEIG
jgi:hypothetical protein